MITVKGYSAVIRPLTEEEGGGWLAEAPGLPGCCADGETRKEALFDLADAIDEWKDAAER